MNDPSLESEAPASKRGGRMLHGLPPTSNDARRDGSVVEMDQSFRSDDPVSGTGPPSSAGPDDS
jgi:hypothetical protein